MKHSLKRTERSFLRSYVITAIYCTVIMYFTVWVTKKIIIILLLLLIISDTNNLFCNRQLQEGKRLGDMKFRKDQREVDSMRECIFLKLKHEGMLQL